MAKSIRAVFDGTVLRPEEPVDLKPNSRCVVTIEAEGEKQEKSEEETYPLSAIASLATDMGVDDLSTRHSWYAHGRLEDNGSGD
jgi:predicted DNA-binding antitoxin AbrB/MazE fold protein